MIHDWRGTSGKGQVEWMKILALADMESKALWDYFDRDKIQDVDLILSCGDLKASYLSFLATMVKVPLLYVHGNHDTNYNRFPPEGCECIEDTIFVHNGIRILGLGGSYRYKPGDYQYTESEMRRRISKLRLALWKNKGFDILLSHAPASGIGDGTDLPHRGFKTFLHIMEKYEPRYFVHGHVHANYNARSFQRLNHYKETTVINAYEKYKFFYE